MRLDSAFVLALLILIVKQTNYMLYIHYTVYCTQYTMYHNLGSVHQKQAEDEDLYKTIRERNRRKFN